MTFSPYIQPGEITSAVLAIVFLVLIHWARRAKTTDPGRHQKAGLPNLFRSDQESGAR